jgi:DNA (cytosine-5)-methyltransferase 1
MNLTGYDIFAGAGGFSLAARRVGVDIRAAVEIDPHAAATYRANFIEGQKCAPSLFEQDIASIDWAHVLKTTRLQSGKCDLLLGGPPCQGFSVHRLKGAGVKDPRNSLLLRYFDCISAVKPRAFVVENVSGLLWPRHSEYLQAFMTLAYSSGYRILGPTVLNARDYGVPQNRKRVFIVGIRTDIEAECEWPPKPTHFAPSSREVMEDGQNAWLTAAAVFRKPLKKCDPNAFHMQPSETMRAVFASTPHNGGSRHQSCRVLSCHKGHDGHKDVYGRIDPDRPGPTMTTACINPSKGRFVHPTEDHGISARHAARFQTFPDDFCLRGGITAAGRQIGNAVPILLGEAVVGTIAACLRLENQRVRSMESRKSQNRLAPLLVTRRELLARS